MTLAAPAAGQRLGLEPVRALARRAGGRVRSFSTTRHELAGLGDAVEAEHLDRRRRAGASSTRSPL